MAIACSTSAFKMPLDDALARVAGLGFSCVDLIAIPSWGHVSAPDLVSDWDAEAGRVEALVRKHGLTPVAMNAAFTHPHQRNDAINAERLAQVEAVTRLMNRLGIRIASFYPGYRAEDRAWDDVLADTVATMREMLAVAAAAGVTLVVEPHFGTPFQTLEQIAGLLGAIPELSIAYDPSHFAMQGIAMRDTEPLLDRAAHVHLRDAAPGKMQMPFGEGTVDIDWLCDALAERSYKGHISLEYLPNLPGGPEPELVKLRDALLARMGTTD
jgi:sugar phosphate isomerase/epimerase